MNLNVGLLGGGIRFINCYLQTNVVSGNAVSCHDFAVRPFNETQNKTFSRGVQPDRNWVSAVTNHLSNHVNSTVRHPHPFLEQKGNKC